MTEKRAELLRRLPTLVALARAGVAVLGVALLRDAPPAPRCSARCCSTKRSRCWVRLASC